MSRKQLAALALAAISLAAAGCGSSKSEATSTAASTTTASAKTTSTSVAEPPATTLPTVKVTVARGKPLTRAQWIAKGDKICGRYQAEIETLSVKKVSELPRVLPQEAAYVRAELGQLVKLVPPAAHAKEWQQLLNATLQWAEGSDMLASQPNLGGALLSSPVGRAVIAVHSNVVQIANHAGFKVC